MRKISFLVAAHNEEKIISETLRNLTSLPYDNYEIIIGLDGCTDRTEEIVKEFKKKDKRIRHYSLDIRKGKPAVINEIIKKAKGEIIVINDADWIFNALDRKKIEHFLSVFDDSKVGGIAESFPVEWDKEKIMKGNLIYKMVAYSTYFWIEFQKERFARKEKRLLYVEDPSLFLTNIFRKKLFKENISLGDDFERTRDIINQGYRVVLLNDIDLPRPVSIYNSISLRGLFKQKVRTAIARRQLRDEKNLKFGLIDYYILSILYLLRKSFGQGLSKGFLVLSWVMITSVGLFVSSFKKLNTQKGWNLRDSR